MGISKVCCRCSTEPNSEVRTPVLRRFSCGVGSVLNEIQSRLISFRLVFFMNVVGLSATEAGVLALYGKISQAPATPLCTFLEERIKIPFLSRKLGRRKSWHFIGTMLLTIVLPLYFGPCFPCKSDGGHWQLMVYILTLSTVLSTSVSLIELGHLTLIPIIAKNQAEAIELTALRFKICTEVQSDHTDITNESFGSETEVSPYHLDHETSKTSIGDDGTLPQAIGNNEKTLVISDDPESAPPVAPAPKTVTA
ncbi:unnamed protein product [Porites evermanni]|uniref:Uncharacterized protein n=1 Tax=Porites evermanni TaxID=104178 RepID=A0ABN8S819_9CNID|nr:unnamed protein product [Porites evermanni]